MSRAWLRFIPTSEAIFSVTPLCNLPSPSLSRALPNELFYEIFILTFHIDILPSLTSIKFLTL
jgi:hypothetical protein